MRLDRAQFRAGSIAVSPLLVGVIPFGLVAGASPKTLGLGAGAAVGFSTIVFAGASQLAAIEALGHGSSAAVAILAAATINLRMLLFSASISPYLAKVPTRQRALAAYVLTDQAYAVSLAHWQQLERDGTPPESPTERLSYYLGTGFVMWSSWQLATIAGAALGAAIPASIPVGFAVPLVFLVLLIPTMSTPPAVMAAGVGGLVAMGVTQFWDRHLAVLIGGIAGVLAGAAIDRSDQTSQGSRSGQGDGSDQ